MTWVEGTAAATSALSILFFILYVGSILRMPTGRRPRVIPVDRFGQPLPADENPDYRDTEEEHH